MTDDQHRLRGLRRIFRRSYISEGKRVPQDPGEQHYGPNPPVVISVQGKRGGTLFEPDFRSFRKPLQYSLGGDL